MSGFIEIKVGNIKAINHSTASVVQFIIEEPEGTVEFWLDTYEIGYMKKLLEQIEK